MSCELAGQYPLAFASIVVIFAVKETLETPISKYVMTGVPAYFNMIAIILICYLVQLECAIIKQSPIIKKDF